MRPRMPIGLPPGEAAAAHARLLTRLLKLMRYLGV